MMDASHLEVEAARSVGTGPIIAYAAGHAPLASRVHASVIHPRATLARRVGFDVRRKPGRQCPKVPYDHTGVPALPSAIWLVDGKKHYPPSTGRRD